MLEFLLCSLFTILPDYLFRTRIQGKRLGVEITFFSVWYVLRWGITSCAILTVSLITMIFYFHPSTSNVTSYFRTVTLLSDTAGRVSEVYVVNNQLVAAGDPIFKLDDLGQQAAVAAARGRVAEVDAGATVAQAELLAATGSLDQARAAFQQTSDELNRSLALQERGSSAVSVREVERLQNLLDVRQGAVDAAIASQAAVQAKIDTLLPAQRATAEASLAQAQDALRRLTVVAGVDGRIQQFTLRPGDIVSPILRPAGVLVPTKAGRTGFQAGFGQINAQVIKPGLIAEMGCLSKPFTIIPMVITAVQDVIPTGQIRPSDQLVDAQNLGRPGTVTAYMEPLYAEQTDDIPPGSTCIANAYTGNHDRIANEDLGFLVRLGLHAVDAVGVVHAVLLRMQMMVLPVQQLVFSGH